MQPIIKRRITLLKSVGRTTEAILHLANYLDIYYSDSDAWAELGGLYSIVNALERAAFCWSEVVLLKPHDPLAHAAYADSVLAQSRGDSLREDSAILLLQTALREYLRSIELYDNFLRGFCGVKVCCSALLSMSPATDDNRIVAKQAGTFKNSAAPSITRQKLEALDLMSTSYLLKRSIPDDKTLNCDGVETFLNTITTSAEVAA